MKELLKSTLYKLLGIFASLSIAICFFGAFFFGAETIIILGILSAQGLVKFWIVYVFCALGMFSADSMWFFVGKIKAFGKLKRFKFIKKSYKKTSELIEKISKKRIFLLLTLLKFVYGIAIPIIMYLGRKKKISYSRFALYNCLIIMPWTAMLAGLGWLAGKGYIFAVKISENIYFGMFILAIIFVLIHVLTKSIRKILKNEFFKSNKNA